MFPLVEEISYIDPASVMAALPGCHKLFLDSASQQDKQSRYSFIALDPFQLLTCKNNVVKINGWSLSASPFEVLHAELAKLSLPFLEDLPPFQGGIAGLLSYELGRYIENLPIPNDDLHFPELILGFYDVVIAWDHAQNQSWIFSSGFPERNIRKQQVRAQRRSEWLKKIIFNSVEQRGDDKIIIRDIKSNFSRECYHQAVLQVKEYIRAGDIFQANISQRFTGGFEDSPAALYQHLRQANPAPFAAFFQHQDYVIASASPERFLRLHQNQVETRPIKGTCARHADLKEDKRLSHNLLNNEKERAENIMIVDLMRNDLSKVCQPFSIQVPQLCALESFATVHHLVSVVQGKLAAQKSALDLIQATFPGGSITGAPKIRAMEIIASIEKTQRGPYCGSLGYIGFNGEMDLSILIRTFVMHQHRIHFQVGGAITIDSDPDAEYNETLVKAKVLERLVE